MYDPYLDKFGVKRTMTAAVDSIIGHLKKKELGKNHLMFLSHAGAPEDAAAVKRRMAEIFPELEILILELGPAFVTQGGPRCLAIQYINR